MRPPRGVREKEDYRNSGTGHEIHFEIEDVLDKKNKIMFSIINNFDHYIKNFSM